jgi:hypothetical protein
VKHFSQYLMLTTGVVVLVALVAIWMGQNAHYREACLECAERCEGYRPIVTTFRTPQGVRYCYCDTTKPDPDELRRITAQQAIDSITSEPPADFHL